MPKLSRPEIYKVVNDYIGVSQGYLGDFSYSTHAEFYPYYCDLDIDLEKYRPGTTRGVFIHILEDVSAPDQAKILKGVLAKYPPEDSERRKKIAPVLRAMIVRLEGAPAVGSPSPKITTATVERAIRDAHPSRKAARAHRSGRSNSRLFLPRIRRVWSLPTAIAPLQFMTCR